MYRQERPKSRLAHRQLTTFNKRLEHSPLEPLSAESRRKVAKEVSNRSAEVYELLHYLALSIGDHRRYSPLVSTVSFWLPLELLALALDCDRTTIWRAAKRLITAGLIDYRPHKCSYWGLTRNDGCVWTVKLKPLEKGRARLRYDDLHQQYRDLGNDVQNGRTVHQLKVQQSLRGLKTQEKRELLLSWALSPSLINLSLTLTVAKPAAPSLTQIFDLPSFPKNERAAAVDTISRAMAAQLQDDSLNLYRKLCWQLLRLNDRGQDYFEGVYHAYQRARGDAQDPDAPLRRPGAVFVALLKEMGVWDEIMRCPPYRVTGKN